MLHPPDSEKSGQASFPDDTPEAFAEVLGELRGLLAECRWMEAASLLQRAFLPTSDFTSLQSLYRIYGKLKPHVEPPQKTRLAILGSFTTTQLAQAIELAPFSMGGGVEIFEADYGVYRQEILDPGSDVYRFRPNIVFLATSWREPDPPAGPRPRGHHVLMVGRGHRPGRCGARRLVDALADGARSLGLPGRAEQFRSAGLASAGQS